MNEAVVVDEIGGNCPVQAEGTVAGKPFYFRARGNSWSMSIGGADVVGFPEWCHRASYGDEPFAAGWMHEEEARAFIAQAAELYLAQQATSADDGQPDEMTEWRDFDPDC